MQKFSSYFTEDTFRLNYKDSVRFLRVMWNARTQCVFLVHIVTTGLLKALTFKTLGD
jgi:coenzyme F420-reducing hydrogenase delta subunit